MALLTSLPSGCAGRDRFAERSPAEWVTLLQSRDRYLRDSATLAFRTMGRRACGQQAHVKVLLSSPDSAVRADAAVAYVHIAPPGEGASVTGELLARDPSPLVRGVAAMELGRLAERLDGAELDRALKRLAMALRADSEAEIRQIAAGELSSLGERAAPVTDALRAALGDPDALVRHEASDALAHIFGRPHR